MFNNYEELACVWCKKKFFGRKPAEGGMVLCIDCLQKQELKVVNNSDKIPNDVERELLGGRGEDE